MESEPLGGRVAAAAPEARSAPPTAGRRSPVPGVIQGTFPVPPLPPEPRVDEWLLVEEEPDALAPLLEVTMSEHELREALARSLERLDCKSELLESFWSALRFRRQFASLDEADDGVVGLAVALERGLRLFGRRTTEVSVLPPEPVSDPNLPTELAEAARVLPINVLIAVRSRFAESGRNLDSEADVRELVEGALRQYARLAEFGLSPGP